MMPFYDIMGEEKKAEMDRVTIKNDVLRKYFPKSYTPAADGGNHPEAPGTVAKEAPAQSGTLTGWQNTQNTTQKFGGAPMATKKTTSTITHPADL